MLFTLVDAQQFSPQCFRELRDTARSRSKVVCVTSLVLPHGHPTSITKVILKIAKSLITRKQIAQNCNIIILYESNSFMQEALY